MNKSSSKLSELEGMILCEIDRQDAISAYALQKTFAQSPSSFWAASKGAIYPAIDRLVDAKLVKAEVLKEDRRGTRHLSLTARGKRSLEGWAGDLAMATSPGVDPFRSRAAYWTRHGQEGVSEILADLEQDIRARIDALKGLRTSTSERGFRNQIDLEIELQKTRLRFLSKRL